MGERQLNPNEIIDSLNRMLINIEEKNVEYEKLGVERAEVERIFNQEFAKKQLVKKNSGTAITILKAQTLGDPKISKLKFRLDVADAKWRACLEALRGLKESIGTMRSFLTWLRMEYGNQNIPERGAGYTPGYPAGEANHKPRF